MAFSYTLFLVLLLIFPGLCFWAGYRAGERTDFLTPSPDSPNSTLTLFIVMLGTLAGHILGAGLFAVQRVWCDTTRLCLPVDYDPNVYRALLKGASAAQNASDLAIELWLFSIFMLGAVMGAIAYWTSRREAVSSRIDPIAFGWLTPAVQAVKRGDSFVVAYVVTKTSHDGISVAYEGIVQQLALDADQSIKLVVLNEVDRFCVQITDQGVKRVESNSKPIPQMHIAAAEIANVALEIVQAPQADVDAVAQESSAKTAVNRRSKPNDGSDEPTLQR